MAYLEASSSQNIEPELQCTMLRTVFRSLFVLAIFLVSACESEQSSDHQLEVAERGAEVMPFDLDRTTHVFEKLDFGGRQQVLSDDGDLEQIESIRQHLEAQATLFSEGDFHNPAHIHGDAMPGLHDLVMAHERLQITFSSLSDGGQIEYFTEDSTLVPAVHKWFDAQLEDHGHHAQDHH